MNLNDIYWNKQHKRRKPDHPVVAAFVQPKLDFIMQHISRKHVVNILDVGCGNGFFTWYLTQIAATTGLDYAYPMIKQSPVNDRLQASVFDLPFLDNSFDLVFCSNLLHHLDNPLQAIREMRRVSRKYVALSEPNPGNPGMWFLGQVHREDIGSLKFSRNYLVSQVQQAALSILGFQTQGMITPNIVTTWMLPLLKRLDFPHPFGAYHICIAEKV